MTTEQIQAGFLSLDPTHPFYQAVQEVVRMQKEIEVDAVAQNNLTDAARHFNAGRLAAVIDVGQLLVDARKEAEMQQAKVESGKAGKRET